MQTSSIYILMQTAACMKMMHELKEAAEVYEHSTFISTILSAHFP